MKRLIVSVNNDIETDKRVARSISAFSSLGYKILVVGKRLPESTEFKPVGFRVKRFRMLFLKGPLFFAFFNIRLFFYLLFHRADMLLSNDPDTLPANYFVSRIKGTPVIYDSHEYFSEMPELVGRERVKKIWRWIESALLPKLKYLLTVNKSIAKLYREEYGVEMKIMRNTPELQDMEPGYLFRGKTIIYQGVLNLGRGLDMVIRAMQYVYDDATLIIAGDGPERDALRGLADKLGLKERVEFKGRLDPGILRLYTRGADLGLSVEENLGLNYYYALPNKLFDYIHAGIPVLVSPFPEMKKIVEDYGVGECLASRDPEDVGRQINAILEDGEKLESTEKNLGRAREELCWQKESKVLLDIIRIAEKENNIKG